MFNTNHDGLWRNKDKTILIRLQKIGVSIDSNKYQVTILESHKEKPNLSLMILISVLPMDKHIVRVVGWSSTKLIASIIETVEPEDYPFPQDAQAVEHAQYTLNKS